MSAVPGDELLAPSAEETVATAELVLKPDFFPIRPTAEFSDQTTREHVDPMGHLLAALETGKTSQRVRIDITVTPATLEFHAGFLCERNRSIGLLSKYGPLMQVAESE